MWDNTEHYLKIQFGQPVYYLSHFSFLSPLGLYRGIKLRDDVGRITDRIKASDFPDLSGVSTDIDFDGGDDLGGIIVAIFTWIIVSILAILLIWTFSAIIWNFAFLH